MQLFTVSCAVSYNFVQENCCS